MSPEERPEQKEDGEKIILYISRFADDNQGKLYEQQLEHEGYSVLLTDSGKSAAAALHKGQGFIDLIVMGRPRPHDLDDPEDFVPDLDTLEQALVKMGDDAPPILIHSSAFPKVAREQYAGTPVEKLIVGYIQKSANPGPFFEAVRNALYPTE